MNKAFVKDPEGEDDELEALAPALPAGTRYYITRHGFQVLKEELDEYLSTTLMDKILFLLCRLLLDFCLDPFLKNFSNKL